MTLVSGLAFWTSLQEIEAVHPGHSDIAEDLIIGIDHHLLQPLLSVRSRIHLEPLFLQDDRQHMSEVLLVIDDENPFGNHRPLLFWSLVMGET